MISDDPEFGHSNLFFRHLLESAPDAMVIVDDSGIIDLVNEQAQVLFGYRRSEMLGQSVEMLLPESKRAGHVAHRRHFAAAPSLRPMGQGMDLVARRKDGSEFPVEISLSPLRARSGRYVTTVIRDVSIRRQMEIDIKAAQNAAERANKANSAFLAAASHDLRQPVQALNLLNGALRRTVKDERALRMIDSQEASLTAMTNLLNSLLDISRLDAGGVNPDFEEFPIQRLVDRLSAEFKRQARSKGLKFSAQSCDTVVRSDPNLLAEVITNLVSNAIRYTQSGEVQVNCTALDGECRLDVVDTGIGIEQDQLEAIFTEFHQCKAPGRSNEGFGLGLAIVRRLAKLLDHRIEVESEPGKGSRFSVTVPIVSKARMDAFVDRQRAPQPPRASGGLIVLIEDDVTVANAWALLLEAEGYRVASASSAKEAATLVEHLEDQPVLIISDFHLLDGSTGAQAIGMIRDYCQRAIPAFIVSGDTSKVVKDARQLENSTLMSKPVDTLRLLTAARHAVDTGEVPKD